MLTRELPGLPMKEDQATQQFMRRSIEQALSGNVKRQREIAARISQAQTETPLFYSVMTAADLTGMPHPPGIVYFVQDEGAFYYYNQGTLAFEATAGGGGGATTLDGLSDVVITTPATNAVLMYNGSAWIDNPLASTHITDFAEAVDDRVGALFIDSTDLDLTYTDGSNTLSATIIAAAVTNAKLANMSASTVKGQIVGGSGAPVDLTATQLNAIVGSVALTMADGLTISTDEVRARDTGGLLLRDRLGNYGIYIAEGGRISVGDGNSPSTSIMRIGGTIGGPGAAALYLDPSSHASGGTQYGIRVVGDPQNATDFVGVGIHGSPNFTNYKASIWVGNEASRPGIIVGYAQTITAPTHGMIMAGNFGLGTSSPQGIFHILATSGGKLFTTKTAINGTAQTLIPDGTGDATIGVKAFYIATGSGGTSTLGSGDFLNNTDNTIFTTGGGSVLKFRVNSNGSVDLRRSAGSETFTVVVDMIWR